MRKNLLYAFCFLILVQYSAKAQKTAVYTDPNVDLKKGMELFTKKKYGSAQHFFGKAIVQNEENSNSRIEAEYYAALCALELFHTDAEHQLQEFILKHPESPNTRLAYFHLGNFHYRKKKYDDAIAWYEKVDKFDLSKEELAEYYFKSGYSYFNLENYQKAKSAFFEIKNVENKYTSPATFYYGHISYLEKKYETALQDFEKLKKDETFAQVVPYYITQIYYLQGKYDLVIQYAPTLLDSATTKRAPEIARLIGEAYYRTKKYKEALPYLEQYRSKASKVSREDLYLIAFTNYRVNDYKNAIKYFKGVTSGEPDTLTQQAYYHLGDAYLRENNKPFARSAFESAAGLNFDAELKESAMFNAAKLSYELAYNPYNQAIEGFKKYIELYPNSERVDEAYEYLVKVYLVTKNYKDALASIELIKNKNIRLQEAYQKIAFNRGVELFNDQKYEEAIVHFDKAMIYQREKAISAGALYWKGEAYYRLSNYDEATKNYNAFLFAPGAPNLPIYYKVNYNLGYANFQKKDYTTASSWFRKYESYKATEDKVKVNDAVNRIADCYFINKEYENALTTYNQSVEMKKIDTDYAIYQKAILYGILGKNDSKINELTAFISNYKKSAYTDDAKFELAKAYLLQNQNEKALASLKNLVKDHPNTVFLKAALLRTGLVYFNSNDNENALLYYKKVISEYPQSTEAKEALIGIKNIYIELGNVDEYVNYAKNLPFGNLSNNELDSTTYEAAELRYMNNDCEKSVNDFKNYLEKFPNGFFALNANYYKADCEFRNKNYSASITGYEYVISQTKNQFTENALIKAAWISYNQKNYEKAKEYYTKLASVADYKNSLLEATIGQMRSGYYLKAHVEAMEVANRLITMEKVPAEIINEAHFIIAKSALALENKPLALAEFLIVSKATKNEMGTEARYNVAELYFQAGDLAKSESAIFDIINQVPSYDYWIANSFILLADIYVAKDDYFQAKQTLQSIIDNYEGTDLRQKAKDKLNKIVADEEFKKSATKQEELEINFNKNENNEKELFEENERRNESPNPDKNQ